MTIYTIGFTKKSARDFFESMKAHNMAVVVDIRLNNSSQLAGFSKGGDLSYFLPEISGCAYHYEPLFAPTKELMDGFKTKKLGKEQFEAAYRQLMQERGALAYYENAYAKAGNVCLLCSEDTPALCHRRILAEMIAENMPQATIQHL